MQVWLLSVKIWQVDNRACCVKPDAQQLAHLNTSILLDLSPVHTGDKVELNTVDFDDSRQIRPRCVGPYTPATKSTVSATKLNVYGNS